MKKVLLIMAAALMTMTQCRKQETSPATPSADTIKMTITAGPGAKTNITDEGAITWTSGDKLYVSDGTNWLGSLTLQSGAGNASGTFTGKISEISDGTTCHFFYLGHDNDMTGASGTTAASISFASQDGSKDDALKYHLGHGSADVTVREGEATGAVRMSTEIAIAHINFTVDSKPYTGAVKMTDVRSTMTVKPDGTFSGSGDGITIGNNSRAGDRYVTLIPTGPGSVNVGFDGTESSLTFGQGIQSNNLYGMATPIPVELSGAVLVESVSLDKTSLSLLDDGTATLKATVSPADALDKSVTWKSSDETKATVDQNGLVTAVGAGTATITVTTTDGGKTATCTVTVTPAHEYVDLGLPSGLLWATCNVGASKPEEYGWYFMWGSTTNGGDSNCIWANCPGNGGNSSYNETAFNTWKSSNLINNVLKLEVDAASVNWGGDWRMPTTAEWKELNENTTSTWTSENGVYGRKFTSKTGTGKYIFLPAAGNRGGTGVSLAGSYGLYWSSLFNPSNFSDACRMSFDSGNVVPQNYAERCCGYSVRPVRAAR